MMTEEDEMEEVTQGTELLPREAHDKDSPDNGLGSVKDATRIPDAVAALSDVTTTSTSTTTSSSSRRSVQLSKRELLQLTKSHSAQDVVREEHKESKSTKYPAASEIVVGVGETNDSCISSITAADPPAIMYPTLEQVMDQTDGSAVHAASKFFAAETTSKAGAVPSMKQRETKDKEFIGGVDPLSSSPVTRVAHPRISVGLALAQRAAGLSDEDNDDDEDDENNDPEMAVSAEDANSKSSNENDNQEELVIATPVNHLQVAERVGNDHNNGGGSNDNKPFPTEQFWGCLAMLVMVISIIVVVVVKARKDDSKFHHAKAGRDEMGIVIRTELSQTLGDAFFGRNDHQYESLPEHQAWNWLVYEDSLQLDHTAPNLLQRFLLAFFYMSMTQEGPWKGCNPPDYENQTFSNTMDLCYYEALVGDGLHFVPGFTPVATDFYEILAMRWLTGPECQWAGVFCNEEDVVEAIHLDGMTLNGTIPKEIGQFNRLKSLSLTNNQLTGPLPDLGRLTELAHLNVQYNEFTGKIPDDWWSLSTLTHLSLMYNPLSVGRLPSTIGQVSNLEYLSLETTKVTGLLPTEIFILSNLAWLHLANTMLSGTIPTEVGLLRNLEMLDMQFTLISGTIPSEIAVMTLLREFGVWGTEVSGTLPTELYSMETDNLKALILAHCNLSGTLSPSIAQMKGLSYILLSKNPRIHGTIPTELGLMTWLDRLNVDGTGIRGSMPDEVCALRSAFMLRKIKADCEPLSNGSIPVFCPTGCCTKCCNQETERCTKKGF